MSFADELRDTSSSYAERQGKDKQWLIKVESSEVFICIQESLKTAAKAGKRQLRGYLNKCYLDSDTAAYSVTDDYYGFDVVRFEDEGMAQTIYENVSRELPSLGLDKSTFKLERIPELSEPGFFGRRHKTGRVFWYYWVDLAW